MRHILLNNLIFKKIESITPPPIFFYEKVFGAWINENNYTLLIQHSEFNGVASKKKDIESGEDQK